jgi:flagellar basal-body rod protein FlgF
MNATARWQEIIAENMATAQVPGYKRQDVKFETIPAGQVPVGSVKGTGSTEYVMPRAVVGTDFQPAGFRATGVETDLALDGQGFFAVQLPDGNVGYTRDGEFHRTPAGGLVTKEGFAVLGDNGPIQLDANNPRLFISLNGDITQGQDQRGKIRVVNFSDPTKLTATGAGYYTNTDPTMKETEMANAVMRQGFLELSNANTVAEMTHMINALRMFEMNQKVVQSQDERMGKTITELTGQV